uniref:Uncharacterized protein n=1 Tax=viral metagenome TaxID=1070528 RepID=A0A6H1Z9E7_9ZZZZ
MSFDAVKCTVEYKDGWYYITMTIRYLDGNGNLIGMAPVSASVEKGTPAEMRTQLVAILKPLIDNIVDRLKDGQLGKLDLVDNITAQVNTYLATKT